MRIFKLADEHEQAREDFSALIDGALDAGKAARVEQHLASCEDCRADFDSLRATVQATRAVPEIRAPRSFALTPNDAVRARESRRPVARARFWTVQRGMEAGAMAAAVLFVALIVGDITTGVSQPAEPVDTSAVQARESESSGDDNAYQSPAADSSATQLGPGVTGTATSMATLEMASPEATATNRASATGTPATATAMASATETATATATTAPTGSPTATGSPMPTGTASASRTPQTTATASATAAATQSPQADVTSDAPPSATEQVFGVGTSEETGGSPPAESDVESETANAAPAEAASNGESGWRIAQVIAATVAVALGLFAISRRFGNQSTRTGV